MYIYNKRIIVREDKLSAFFFYFIIFYIYSRFPRHDIFHFCAWTAYIEDIFDLNSKLLPYLILGFCYMAYNLILEIINLSRTPQTIKFDSFYR